jgi:hypothetical protein
MAKILNLDYRLEEAASSMKLGQPLEIAYPKLQKSRFNSSSQDLKHALNWMWLQTHKGTSHQETLCVVKQIVRRSLAFYDALSWDSSRDQHDYVLINAAILVDDPELLAKALMRITVADEKDEMNNYWRALTGILKFMLANDQDRAGQQFQMRCLCKGTMTPTRTPKTSFLKAFIAGDAKSLQRQAKTLTENCWKIVQDYSWPTVLKREGDCEIKLKLAICDALNFWPWPEVAILKLMARNGTEFETDEFWVPKILINRAV